MYVCICSYRGIYDMVKPVCDITNLNRPMGLRCYSCFTFQRLTQLEYLSFRPTQLPLCVA